MKLFWAIARYFKVTRIGSKFVIDARHERIGTWTPAIKASRRAMMGW